ncbi:hypothetical protein B484DRAFT_445186 [Ochromonadaceae sp. CCMP2298]|nr:hypothetical protein B484DRAFT_445186 [Ochromonadaceae sp. CCMP2298]
MATVHRPQGASWAAWPRPGKSACGGGRPSAISSSPVGFIQLGVVGLGFIQLGRVGLGFIQSIVLFNRGFYSIVKYIVGFRGLYRGFAFLHRVARRLPAPLGRGHVPHRRGGRLLLRGLVFALEGLHAPRVLSLAHLSNRVKPAPLGAAAVSEEYGVQYRGGRGGRPGGGVGEQAELGGK